MHDRDPPTDSHVPERTSTSPAASEMLTARPEQARPTAATQHEFSARITGYARPHDEGQFRSDEHRE